MSTKKAAKGKVLQTEPNTTYRKCKESAHMSLMDHPISQHNLDISPIWTVPLSQQKKKKTTSFSVDYV
jgi:hypothetical protein